MTAEVLVVAVVAVVVVVDVVVDVVVVVVVLLLLLLLLQLPFSSPDVYACNNHANLPFRSLVLSKSALALT